MNKTILAVALAAVTASAFAADAPAPAPDYTLTANVGAVSDYYFRGQTQTWHKPALQGGIDFVHSSGWYAGLWGSSVSGNQYPNGSGLELDYYGGYNGTVGDFGYTAGLYGYEYTGAHYNNPQGTKFNTLEFNIGGSWKWASVKYSQALTDYFGANIDTGFTGKSSGSSYLEANIAYPLMDDLTLNLHAGHTNFKSDLAAAVNGSTNPDYSDYKVGLTKTFTGGWNVGAAYVVATNSTIYGNVVSAVSTDTANLVKGTLVISAGRSF
ncbi:MAG: hypothetical protein HOP20_01675 [Sulfuriferula sp.]|nr:hypothetical protein [Sulfuriferula sp.]